MSLIPDDLPAGDPPAGDPPATARPEWLPEKFWTPEGPNVENLAKSYGELERTRGASLDHLREQWEAERLGVRPEAPDKYELPASELIDVEQMAASPIVSVWRQLAYENGLPQDKFSAAIQSYAEAEVARLDAQVASEMAALGENGKQRAEAVGLWAKSTFGDGPKFNAIAQVCSTAAGVEAIEAIMASLRDSGGNPQAFDGSHGQPEESEADIRSLMSSREYWDPKKRDPSVVARVEAFYAKRYSK